MALYSHKHKLLYYHIFKTGGMSVRTAMNSMDEGCINIIRGHADVIEVYNYFKSNQLIELYENIQKFTVVRNPYTWLYSVYNFAIQVETHAFHTFVVNNDFDEFINWYIECIPFFNASSHLNGKIQTQSEYVCINNIPQVQHVLKFESLADDFNAMLEKLNIQFPHRFPYVNPTDYLEKEVDFTTILKRSTLDKFNNYFHNDFINFNYNKL